MHIAVGLFGNFQQALRHTTHLFACETLQERMRTFCDVLDVGCPASLTSL